jgi:hypothetical protein
VCVCVCDTLPDQRERLKNDPIDPNRSTRRLTRASHPHRDRSNGNGSSSGTTNPQARLTVITRSEPGRTVCVGRGKDIGLWHHFHWIVLCRLVGRSVGRSCCL